VIGGNQLRLQRVAFVLKFPVLRLWSIAHASELDPVDCAERPRPDLLSRHAAVKVFTRRGNDWTNRFRKIAGDAWHINAGSAMIDGEVVVPAADGTMDFSVLQNELKGAIQKDRDGRLRPALSRRLRPTEGAAVRA
jgi:hypothetical protein